MAKSDRDRKLVRAQARSADARAARAALEAGEVRRRGEPAPRVITPKKPYLPREAGLTVLHSKRKLEHHQVKVGQRYGLLYRIASVEGEALIRSQLADADKRFGSKTSYSPGALESAAFSAEVRRDLAMARWDGLRDHVGLVAACDVICGKEWTPGMATNDRFEQLQIETSIRIALDLLHAFWRENPPASIGYDAGGSGHFVQRGIAA